MDFLNDMFMLNSTYNESKIFKLFSDIMLKYGIDEYSLDAQPISHIRGQGDDFSKSLFFDFGYYKVLFSYNGDTDLSEDFLKILISSAVISLENSSLYSMALNSDKYFNSFSKLNSDIEIAAKVYERYGTPFSVCKICIPNSDLPNGRNNKIQQYCNVLSDNIRPGDKVYDDGRDVFVLFQNADIHGGLRIVNKLKSLFPDAKIGIAQWESKYVASDMFEEIDNFIFLYYYSDGTSHNFLSVIDKIFNRSIMTGDRIHILKLSGEFSIADYMVYSFKLGNYDFALTKNIDSKLLSDLKDMGAIVYEYNFEDYAKDALLFFKEYME